MNASIVTDSQRAVVLRHPYALTAYNYNSEGFKVYCDDKTWVALSASFPTIAEAWDDAARRLKRE